MPLFKIRKYHTFTSQTFYHLRKIKYGKMISKVKREIKELKAHYEKLLKKQEANLDMFIEYTNVKSSLRKHPEDGEAAVIIVNPGNEYYEKMLLKLANDITVYYRLIKEKEKELLELRSKHFNERIIAFMLKEYYNELSYKLVRNDKFYFGRLLGVFFMKLVKSYPRHNKSTGEYHYPINWIKSVERKKQIIAEGKTPYHATDNPNGVKWLIFNLDDRIYIHWHRFLMPNSLYSWYLFKPCHKTAVDIRNYYYEEHPEEIQNLKVYDKGLSIV